MLIYSVGIHIFLIMFLCTSIQFNLTYSNINLETNIRAVQAQVKRRGAGRIHPRITIPHIHVGDMVLVTQTTCVHKIHMHWTGPHVVVAAVSRYYYVVEPMVSPPQKRTRKTVHIVCMRRFTNGALGTEADRVVIEQAAVRDFPDNFVTRFVTHRRNRNNHAVEFQVR